MEITIEFDIFKLIEILNFSFNKQFWLLEQISKKSILLGENTKISVSTNFQLKLTIATFWTRSAKKGSYFQPKTDKIDTTIEFCIFKLVFVSNFTLNKQFWIFGPNLPKKDIYGQKQKKWTSSLNSETDNFDFFDQIYPKRVFLV